MTYKDFEYISDQIFTFLSNEKERKVKAPNDSPDRALGLEVCDFPSNFPKPNWLNEIFVAERMSLTDGAEYYKYDYFEFSLFIAKGDMIKEVLLTVRWEPLPHDEKISLKGRNAPKRTSHYTIAGKFDITRDIEEGYRNLIIVDGTTSSEEVNFQIASYLIQESIAKDCIILLPEFKKLIIKADKRIDINSVDIDNILISAAKRFSIPNDSKSFISYLRLLLRRVKKIVKVNDILDYSGELSSEGDILSVEMDSDNIQGVNIYTLYTLIHRGKLFVPKDSKGRYQWDEVKEQIDIYKDQLSSKDEKKRNISYLSQKLSEAREISIDSSKRTIRRWRKKGMSNEIIARKIMDITINKNK